MAVTILDPILPPSTPSRASREQRIAPRVSCRIPVELDVEGRTHGSTLRDISATGAAVSYPRHVELGEVFHMSFTLPDADETEVSCAGLVRSFRVHDEGRVVGLEFHNLDPSVRRDVASWVRAAKAGDAPTEERRHWGGESEGVARLVSREELVRPVLRWAPGMATLWREVAAHVAANDMVFVPTDEVPVVEGERCYLELVAPSSHAVLRLLAEVVWVSEDRSGQDQSGVGLRIAGLTPMDRELLGASVRFLRDDLR